MKNPKLKQAYMEFMSTYAELEHMERMPEEETKAEVYYLLHYAVVKSTDSIDKVRVVFNAFFRTTSGISLNDLLLSGPKLQLDLWLVLTRWRLLRFAFITDIVKMFKQIKVNPEDANLQRILWRADPADEIREYRLVTVIYGTKPAPYLAIRTLQQLAHDEELRFPFGSNVIRSHTYVDDVLADTDTLADAIEIKRQTQRILNAGGFLLSKWAGTHAALCPDGSTTDRLIFSVEHVGALGVVWSL